MNSTLSQLIVTLLFASCIGCDGQQQDPRVESIASFNPLALPALLGEPQPFLDPIALHSDNAYTVRPLNGSAKNEIDQVTLLQASHLEDLIPNYPDKWIEEYRSVVITVMQNEDFVTVSGETDLLTASQRDLLQTAKPGALIEISLDYWALNIALGEKEPCTLHYTCAVVPTEQAIYPEGPQALTQLLRTQLLDAIASDIGWLTPSLLEFTVNAEGKVEDVRMIKSSGNAPLDRDLIRIVQDLPSWTPAKDQYGVRIQQRFEFALAQAGC